MPSDSLLRSIDCTTHWTSCIDTPWMKSHWLCCSTCHSKPRACVQGVNGAAQLENQVHAEKPGQPTGEWEIAIRLPYLVRPATLSMWGLTSIFPYVYRGESLIWLTWTRPAPSWNVEQVPDQTGRVRDVFMIDTWTGAWV